MKSAQRINIGPLHLNLVTTGPEDAEAILMLHGFPDFHYGWRQQFAFLEERGYRLLVPDQRGYHLSDKPEALSAYSLETLGQDMLSLLDHYQISKVCVMGHDWGGAVAWWLAHHHPERIEKLIIMNMPHPEVFKQHLKNSRSQQRKSWYLAFFQLPYLPEWILSWNQYTHFSQTLKEDARRGAFNQQDLERYIQAWSQPGAMSAMLNWYRAAWRFPHAPFPETPVQPKTLIFWGLKDQVLEAEMIQPTLERCAQGKAMKFKYAGHWVHHDEYEAVNDAILNFLKKK